MKIATIVLLAINALLLAANIGIQVAVVQAEVSNFDIQKVINHALQAEIKDLDDRIKILEGGTNARRNLFQNQSDGSCKRAS